MNFCNKTIKSFFILSSLFLGNAYAIDVIPPIAIPQAKTSVNMPSQETVTPTISTRPPSMAPIADHPQDNASYGQGVAVSNTASNVGTPPIATSAERVYYARSMTSNNPEYKTRFSILHETPSPKRVAGERLYNLSDETFRLAVSGSQIRILDNPIFKLTGINSAVGRTGELSFQQGGILTVHGTSPRFKGLWDVDGTGPLGQKVTPNQLVSGDIPATLITRNLDGSVRTHENYVLTFKAMATGPYNGYWTDGRNFSIWLWGMSKSKTQSGEFTYVGLDLGIVTMDAPSIVSQPAATAYTGASAPIAPTGGHMSGSNGAYPAVVPAPVGGNFYSGGFGGGGGGMFPMPIGGGFGGGNGYRGGGGGFTPPPVDFCSANPQDSRCLPPVDYCTKNPQDPKCVPPVDYCTKNPQDPKCNPKKFCELYPNDIKCICEKNPQDPQCKPVCPPDSTDPKCKICEYGGTYPNCNHPDPNPPCTGNNCTPTSEPSPALMWIMILGLFAVIRKFFRK